MVNILSGKDISLNEFEEVGAIVNNVIHSGAVTLIGTAYEPDMENEIRVSIIATGIAGLENTNY